MDKIINNYKILEKIGEGSYSKVKKTINILDNKIYAVKIFNKYFLQKRKKPFKGKFISDYEQCTREINALQHLSHPNLIRLYEIIENEKK
mgnify:CR=1 FL=1